VAASSFERCDGLARALICFCTIGVRRKPGGSLGTHLWIDPERELIVIFVSQSPEFSLPYRYLMRQLVCQALEG
jgi:hypothetical protein